LAGFWFPACYTPWIRSYSFHTWPLLAGSALETPARPISPLHPRSLDDPQLGHPRTNQPANPMDRNPHRCQHRMDRNRKSNRQKTQSITTLPSVWLRSDPRHGICQGSQRKAPWHKWKRPHSTLGFIQHRSRNRTDRAFNLRFPHPHPLKVLDSTNSKNRLNLHCSRWALLDLSTHVSLKKHRIQVKSPRIF
jgi:hypothetical protein